MGTSFSDFCHHPRLWSLHICLVILTCLQEDVPDIAKLWSSYHYSYSRPQASTYISLYVRLVYSCASLNLYLFLYSIGFSVFFLQPLDMIYMLWACAVMFELIPHGYSRWSCNYLGSQGILQLHLSVSLSQSVRLLIWVNYHHHSKLNAKDIRLMITRLRTFKLKFLRQTGVNRRRHFKSKLWGRILERTALGG